MASFPLAPLFAILNNVLEMRLDARKLLVFYRRPVGQRVRDIGIWYKILNTVGKLAVLSNVSYRDARAEPSERPESLVREAFLH